MPEVDFCLDGELLRGKGVERERGKGGERQRGKGVERQRSNMDTNTV
jgi:hypothetical protein